MAGEAHGPIRIGRPAVIVRLRDGLKLHVRDLGTAEGVPLFMVHGLGGSSQTWGEEALHRLAGTRRVIAVDLPGHGSSDAPREPGRLAFAAIVADLTDLLSSLDIESAIWVGYSMGGRLALGAGLLGPGRVAGLVLESASPGLEDAGARAERRRSDERLARRIESEGIEAFLRTWEALPVFASQRRLSPQLREELRRQRRANDPASLATCLRGLGQGMQPSLWAGLEHVAAPVQLLVGELDEKYLEINRRMLARIPDARLTVAAGAGHNVHFEQPETWLSAVESCR